MRIADIMQYSGLMLFAIVAAGIIMIACQEVSGMEIGETMISLMFFGAAAGLMFVCSGLVWCGMYIYRWLRR